MDQIPSSSTGVALSPFSDGGTMHLAGNDLVMTMIRQRQLYLSVKAFPSFYVCTVSSTCFLLGLSIPLLRGAFDYIFQVCTLACLADWRGPRAGYLCPDLGRCWVWWGLTGLASPQR